MAIIRLDQLPICNEVEGNAPLLSVVGNQTVQVPASAVGGGGIIDPQSSLNGCNLTINAATSSSIIGNKSAILGGYQQSIRGRSTLILGGSGNNINARYSVGNLIAGSVRSSIERTRNANGICTDNLTDGTVSNSIIGSFNGHICGGSFNTIIGSESSPTMSPPQSIICGGSTDAQDPSLTCGLPPKGNFIIGTNGSTIATDGTRCGAGISNNNFLIGGNLNKILSGQAFFSNEPDSVLPDSTLASGLLKHPDNVVQNSSILFGRFNCIYGSHQSSIINGFCNRMSTYSNNYNSRKSEYSSSIGYNTMMSTKCGFISGGRFNSIIASNTSCILSANAGGNSYNVIIGARCSCAGSLKPFNSLGVTSNVILGGNCNCVSVAGVAIGGFRNNNGGYRSTILGGYCNSIRCFYDGLHSKDSVILAGKSNTMNTSAAVIGGGIGNVANHDQSTIFGTGITTVSGCMLHANTLFLSADALPSTDPNLKGVVWRDGTDLKISMG